MLCDEAIPLLLQANFIVSHGGESIGGMNTVIKEKQAIDGVPLAQYGLGEFECCRCCLRGIGGCI